MSEFQALEVDASPRQGFFNGYVPEERDGSCPPHLRRRKLAYPITLWSGETIRTVVDALELMQSLPEKRQKLPSWQITIQCVLEAIFSRDAGHMEYATSQLKRAIDAEGPRL